MNGWEQCCLGEMITLKRGYDLPASEREEGDVPVVSSAGISGCHREAKVTGPGIVTGRYGTLGEVYYIESDFWPLNTALYVQEFNGNDPRFVSYFLRTLGFEQQNAAGAVPGVNRNHLHQLQVRVPPVDEQRRIASVLSAYDDLIDNNARRIAILEEMAQSIYREWFIDFRFPGHEAVELVESELGPVPAGWESATLDQVATINRENAASSEHLGEIAYVNISAVSPGTIDEVERMAYAEAPSRARRKVRDGDIIWSTVRPSRRSYSLVLDPEANTVVSTGFAVITPTALPVGFLYGAVTTPTFVDHLVSRARGSAYPSVNVSDVKDAPVLRPPIDIAKRYHDTVEPLLRLRRKVQMKNENLRQTRDLLLPRLISGELDVADLDIDTGDVAA